MKKLQRRTLVLSYTLFLALFFGFLLPFTSYADDSLTGFQQEVIYAKEKHQAISGKVQSANLVLDQDKYQALKAEADDLIDELIAKRDSSSVSAEKPVAEIPLKQTENLSGKTKETKAKKAKNGWWPFGGGSGKAPAYKEKSLTEGDALYKVAVSDNKLSLKEAVDIGLSNNLQIKAYKKKIEVAEAKLVEAKRALFPTVQAALEENAGKVAGGETNPSGRFYKGRNYKLNVTQPIFYGGELIFTVKQAEANVRSSKAEYEKIKDDFMLQVKTSYYGVVKAEYNTQYQADLYDTVNTIYKQVKKEHDEKLISELDFLNVESQYHQVFFQVESAKNDLLSANLVLRQSLGLDNEEPMPLDLKLDFVKVSPSFNEIMEIAIQNNPELEMKRLSLESAEWGIKIFKAKKLPRVDVRGSYGLLGEVFKDSVVGATPGEEHLNQDLDLEKEWFLGATVSMPVGPNSLEYNRVKHVYGPTVLALHGSEDWSDKLAFNLFDKLSDITDEKSAQATLLQSQSDWQKAKDDLTLKIREDFYTLQKSLIQIDSTIAKVRYQEKQNSVQGYLLGLQETSAPSYMEGLVDLAQDKFSFIQAVSDYNLAVEELAVSIGDPYYFEAETAAKITE